MTDRYDISPAVRKALKDANLTAEKVLRQALGIKEGGFATAEGPVFPEGTVFLAWYKERAHSAIVRDGLIDIDGKKFTSVSGAAGHITGRPTTNGWSFWQVKLPNKCEFVPISKFREESNGLAA